VYDNNYNFETQDFNKQFNPSIDLHLNGVAIGTVKEQKLLGIIIHSTLSWKPHINNVCINKSKDCTI